MMIYMILYEMLHILEKDLRLLIEIYLHGENDENI